VGKLFVVKVGGVLPTPGCVQRDPDARGMNVRVSAQKFSRDLREEIIEKRDLSTNKTLQWSEAHKWGERGELVG